MVLYVPGQSQECRVAYRLFCGIGELKGKACGCKDPHSGNGVRSLPGGIGYRAVGLMAAKQEAADYLWRFYL